MAVGLLEPVAAAPAKQKRRINGWGYGSINRPPLTGFATAALRLANTHQAHLWVAAHFLAACSTGRVKKKVEPSPGLDSTHIVPPWHSTIFLAMARPMPVPG
jgi:hypothetical protein